MEEEHERRVRQRTGESSHDAAAAVLDFLRGVRTNPSIPDGSEGRRVLAEHLGDIDSIPDETLVDAARAFADEWCDRYVAPVAPPPVIDEEDASTARRRAAAATSRAAGELQAMVRRLLVEKRADHRRITQLEARNAELRRGSSPPRSSGPSAPARPAGASTCGS